MNECPFCKSSCYERSATYDECFKCNILISRVDPAVYDDTYYYAKDFRTTSSLHRSELLYNYFRNEINNKRCLDFGCNDGSFVTTMVRKGFSCVGVDINKSILTKAKAAVGGEFYHTSELNSKFSCITAFDVIEHFNNLEDFFLDCSRWLEPRGTLIITTPNKDSKWFRLFRDGWHGLGIPQYHRYVFSQQFLESQLSNYGYSVKKSFSVTPIEKNGWRLLLASGYRLRKSIYTKMLTLPWVFILFLYGKLLLDQNEDTICIVAYKYQ